MRRAAVAILLLAGCGGGDDPKPRPAPQPTSAPASVVLTVNLERDPTPPDAGTRGGHQGGYRLRATGRRVRFTGTVDPPEAELTVSGPRLEVFQVLDRFSVVVPNLPRGETRVNISANAPGLVEAGADVMITR